MLHSSSTGLRQTTYLLYSTKAIPEADSSTAVAALGTHEAWQQIQGVAPLCFYAGQHIAVGMHKPGLQAGSPGQVAVGAGALPLYHTRRALLAA